MKLTAIDPEDDPLACKITGREDQAKFALNSSTCRLCFLQVMDFEKPVDSNSDNGYKVNVQVSDEAGLVATQSLVVTVTDVEENSTSIFVKESTTLKNGVHYEAYDLLGRPE